MFLFIFAFVKANGWKKRVEKPYGFKNDREQKQIQCASGGCVRVLCPRGISVSAPEGKWPVNGS